MSQQFIKHIRKIPGLAGERIADELEAFSEIWERNRGGACIRAQRFADNAAQYIYSRQIGPAGALPVESMLHELANNGLVTPKVVKAFQKAHTMGQAVARGVVEQGAAPWLEPADMSALRQATEVIAQWLLSHSGRKEALFQIEDTYVIPNLETTLQDVQDALAVDIEVYSQHEAAYVADEAVLARWYEANPNMWTLLRDRSTNQIVGYINAMPVTKEVFLDIKTGNINEQELGPQHIVQTERAGYYYMYFCSIAIRPTWRTSGNFRKLLDGFAANLGRFAHQSIFFREIVADAVTAEGRQICEGFGMKAMTRSDRNTLIFHLSLLPPDFRQVSKNAKQLHSFYSELYERLKRAGRI